MRKKYKLTHRLASDGESVVFSVKMRLLPGIWVTLREYHEPDDPAFAAMLAEELMEKLADD